ncbi:hypothetical protein JTB14_037815 [Gonioctena quinquepunctata]|nr:hypothetical protein JTB14_037815 [Gonioctena quinquepunctata]
MTGVEENCSFPTVFCVLDLLSMDLDIENVLKSWDLEELVDLCIGEMSTRSEIKSKGIYGKWKPENMDAAMKAVDLKSNKEKKKRENEGKKKKIKKGKCDLKTNEKCRTGHQICCLVCNKNYD